MDEKKILLISGDIGAGKDTLADSLVNHYTDFIAKKLNFADRLKQIVRDIFKVPQELLWGTQEDKYKLTNIRKPCIDEFYESEFYSIRELIQVTADKLKEIDELCFCKPISSFIQSCQASPGNSQGWYKGYNYFFIADFRFPYEYAHLKEFDGFDVKTLRLGRSGDTNNHNSEQSLKNFIFDFYIENDNLNKEQTFFKTLAAINNWLQNKTEQNSYKKD